MIHHLLEFLEFQRSVVEGSRQAESILYKVLLPSSVTAIHGADLRNTDVAFVYDEQIVLREEIEKAVRPLSRGPSVKVSGIILYSGTVAQFFYHFHIIFHAFLDALRLDGVSKLVEKVNLLDKVVLNASYSRFRLLFARDKKIGRVDLIVFERGEALETDTVQFVDGVYFIVPPTDTQYVFAVGHEDVNGIAFYAEVSAFQFDVIPDVERIDKLP